MLKMKTIGILGGMSWESTLFYYQKINQSVCSVLGGLHSAKVLIYSFDFEEIQSLQHAGNWAALADKLIAQAKNLETAGADFFIIATNTMHKLAPQIETAVTKPILHIATPTIDALKRDGIKNVALLGTQFTMEHDFYINKLTQAGLNVLVPQPDEKKIVHDIIYNELCLGIITESSAAKYQKIIDTLKNKGAEAVILGCTEICMIVKSSSLPLYDTTSLHANAAAEFAIKN